MKENQKKSFDFAAETTKQLITISTAIITLTVTFSKDILGGAENAPKTLLVWTWGIFIASIICGVMTLMTLTGTLQPMQKKESEENPPISDEQREKNLLEKISINNGNIRLFSIGQSLLFVVAIIMTGFFGYKSLSTQTVVKENKKEYMVIRSSTLNNDTTIYIDTLYLPTGK